MRTTANRTLEQCADGAASLALAGACSYALASFAAPAAFAWSVAALAGLAVWRGLRAIDSDPAAAGLARFTLAPLPEAADDDVLVLTDADLWQGPSPAAASEDALLLDDRLAPSGANSRVVRLFDCSAMPTPGQLKASIDRHLAAGGAAPTSASPDASEDLYRALADLRRSLR